MTCSVYSSAFVRILRRKEPDRWCFESITTQISAAGRYALIALNWISSNAGELKAGISIFSTSGVYTEVEVETSMSGVNV